MLPRCRLFTHENNNLSQNLYKAVYTDDIFITSDRPVFVYWNGSTKNTPFKAGLTDCQEGFAFRYGAWADYMTVVCFVKNDSRMWVWSKSRNEWVEYASKSDLSKIGTQYMSGWKGGVSITSDGTATKIAEITLEAGSYIINGSVSGKGIDSLYIMKDDSIITSLTIDGTRDMNERIMCTVVLPTQCKMSVSARTWNSNVIAGGAIDALQVK